MGGLVRCGVEKADASPKGGVGRGEFSSLPQSHHKWRKKLIKYKNRGTHPHLYSTQRPSLSTTTLLSCPQFIMLVDLSGRGVFSLESLN